MTLPETIAKLKLIREEAGYSNFDQAVKKINRERLQDKDGRQKRKHFPWSKYESLYKKQRGICPWCGLGMMLIKQEIELDHKDPNAEDFNADSNLQVLHSSCNRQKNSMSIADQAKHQGQTFAELLK